MQNNHDDHRDDMAEAFHGIANETGRSEFVKAAKAAEEAFGEDATDPLGSETWDQLRASIAELEAQLAAEREAVRVLGERVRSCEHMLACYRVGRRPSEIALDTARSTSDAVDANPIASAAIAGEETA